MKKLYKGLLIMGFFLLCGVNSTFSSGKTYTVQNMKQFEKVVTKKGKRKILITKKAKKIIKKYDEEKLVCTGRECVSEKKGKYFVLESYKQIKKWKKKNQKIQIAVLKQKKEYIRCLEKFMEKYQISSKDPFNAVLKLEELFQREFSYDKKAAKTDNTGTYDMDFYFNYGGTIECRPYQMIKLRKGICADYSRVFYDFCTLLHIPVRVIYSDDHAWNQVYINGVWKNIDVTWGYYLKNQEFFYLDHKTEMKNSHIDKGVMPITNLAWMNWYD